jgi:UDP-glucose 4-epimerase
VHLAAIHNPQFAVSADTYHSVNCVLTVKLARAAHKIIPGKFVFVSTIRAQCGSVHEGIVLESDPPQPTDDYGRAKHAAEAEIATMLTRGNYTILRPVLVYGAGMKSNMAKLMTLAALPVPLPLNSLTGKRSLLDRGALCRAIIHSLNEAKTDGGTFIVADTVPVTIPDIVAATRRGLGRNPNLFSCPPWLLNIVARVSGQSDRQKRLNSDLVASSAKLQSTGWVAVDSPARRIEELTGRLYRETWVKQLHRLRAIHG